MAGIARDPEAARQARIEREEKAARAETERKLASRLETIAVLNIGGVILLAAGIGLLLFSSGGSVEGIPIANFNKMLLGQTLAMVGGIFVAAAAVIRTR